MYFLRLWKNMHYSSTTNAILLLTLNLCVYFIYFIAVNTLGGNFFLICRNWPDDLLSFARRGELSRDWRGVSPLHTPPPGSFGPDHVHACSLRYKKGTYFIDNGLTIYHGFSPGLLNLVTLLLYFEHILNTATNYKAK